MTVEQLETDPISVVNALRSTEPVSWIPALDAWLITRRDLAIEAMRDADTFTVDDPRFTTGAVLGPSMLSLDGPEHQRHRTPFAPAFRPGILREQFDEFLETEVSRLLAKWTEPTFDLRTGLAGPLAVNTITRFLGLQNVSADDVLEWYESISTAITDLTTGNEMSDTARSDVAEIRKRVQATLDSSADTSLLHAVQASGALRPDEMGSAAIVLMFGAIETAEGMTANAFWHLFTTPGAWTAVIDDPSKLAPAIEESLRLEPAASVIDRYATRDVSFGGADITQGDLVTISLLGANHDPDHFDDAGRYDIDRANARQHVTFVQGPHGCLGLHLARMETAAAIKGVIATAADLEFVPEASAPPRGLIFRKPAAVTVRMPQRR